jgi:hypothetical protein
MPFGRFDRSKESILLVVVYHDAHPRLLARLVLRSIVRSFRFTIMNQLGNPRHRRLKVVRHQPNGMDRIQRSTFCCCLLGIPDSASVGGLSANQAKVKPTSKIGFLTLRWLWRAADAVEPLAHDTLHLQLQGG